MLSKYTFMAPNLIRVSGEGADYAHLITSASSPRISKEKISQNFMAFSEYMNFKWWLHHFKTSLKLSKYNAITILNLFYLSFYWKSLKN